MKIWTRRYNAWVMGGSTWTDVACEVDDDGLPRHDVGKGFEVVEVTSPSGKAYYVEPTSGGFVGNDLNVVRDDMKEADPEFVKKQQDEMWARGQRAELMTPEEFWASFREERK